MQSAPIRICSLALLSALMGMAFGAHQAIAQSKPAAVENAAGRQAAGKKNDGGKQIVDPQHSAKMAAGLKLFREHVREVLIERCLDCHGGVETEGEFDLRTRAALLKGGAEGKAIQLGQAKKSRMYKLITHQLAPEMPYEEQKLGDKQIAAIAKWIELGAPYDKPLLADDQSEIHWTERRIAPAARNHWAFRPLGRYPAPKVANQNWPRTPIDRFVLAEQEKRGLKPVSPAAREVLIRRAYFDLIGLPPTPAAVQEFAQSKDPLAYEKLIDSLLENKHYGERWGRHWLDLARFAESHGFEQDYDRPHAYHYRDFVIKALNQDMPYTQFVSWQLAGDEIAPENPLAMMATGFLGAGVFPTQLTEKEFESARYDELDDMVSTMGTAMLGLTIGCARCHDHKFDPIPQADYYRLVSTFRTTIRSEIDLDLSTPAQRAQAERQRLADLKKARARLTAYEAKHLPDAFKAFLADHKSSSKPARAWDILSFRSALRAGGEFTPQADGSLRLKGPTPAKDTYTLVARTNRKRITAIRLEALADPAFPRKGPGLANNGNFCLSDIRLQVRDLKSNTARQVKFSQARVTHEQNKSSLSAVSSFDSDANTTGWAVDRGGIGKDQAAIFVLSEPIAFEEGGELTVTLQFQHPNTKHAIGRPRLAITSANPMSVDIRGDAGLLPTKVADTIEQLAKGADVGKADRLAAQGWFASTLPEWQKLSSAVHQLEKSSSKGKPVKVMVCSEGLPKMKHHADGRGFPHFYPTSHFLKRGDVTQKEREAPVGYLQVLMRSRTDAKPNAVDSTDPAEAARHWQIPPAKDSRTSYRRRSLANWITDTESGAGHLLARVIVNRLWQHHMGRGIVATSNGFGAQGAAPTHPELLDWLANELIRGDWRLKRIHKLIMLSSVYRQSTSTVAANEKIDLENRWLWRRTPRRLEAEVIRDAMLQVSGELDATPFGPGTLNEGMRRRSIYFKMKRSKLIPMMQLFDQPEPLVSQGGRQSTTIAPQALMFMNSPHVRNWAGKLAERLAKSAQESLAKAVTDAYWQTLSRGPSEEEVADNVAFLESQVASYESEKKRNARQMALQDFCQVMLSLNEFVYIK